MSDFSSSRGYMPLHNNKQKIFRNGGYDDMRFERIYFSGYNKKYGEEITKMELKTEYLVENDDYFLAYGIIRASQLCQKNEDVPFDDDRLIINLDVDETRCVYELHIYMKCDAVKMKKQLSKYNIKWEIVKEKTGYEYVKVPLLSSYGTFNKQKISDTWESVIKRYAEMRGFQYPEDEKEIKPSRPFCCMIPHAALFCAIDKW